MKFYTGAGDKGETCITGKNIRKDDPVIEAIGEIDELNASIGVAMSFQTEKKIIDILKDVQNKLFVIGAEICCVDSKAKITEENVKDLESKIDSFEVGELKKFVLPSGSKPYVFLHLARTIARRTERKVVKISKMNNINEYLLKYLNRLSSLLFVMSLYVNRKVKKESPTYS
jgi:cob(I)alamin adenosyltransferase